MSKKRPRPILGRQQNKLQPGYWRGRLFRNSFTYKGKRKTVPHWCVKIQYLHCRKTFALKNRSVEKAAAEACKLYDRLLDEGWDAIDRQWKRERLSSQKFEEDYWAERLIHREYTAELHPTARSELSVRIEHEGTSHYFPLRTEDEKTAAGRALRIYQALAREGWRTVNERYPRELTIGFRWGERPLAWTYTTIHTQAQMWPSGRGPAGHRAAGRLSVAIAEADAGVARALAWCINQQPGFGCSSIFETRNQAVAQLGEKQPPLVLISQTLDENPGDICQQFKTVAPGTACLLYSAYEDSEQLFRTTPGGAGTYLLKRTRPTELLEPIEDMVAMNTFSLEEMNAAVWRYFKNAFESMRMGEAANELTNLTQREHEVLVLLSKGQPDKEIAEQLGISSWTVHAHVRKILEKLGVHNRTGAVVKYLQK
jgi:DNA-binding NarL/FixJ family response regulator